MASTHHIYIYRQATVVQIVEEVNVNAYSDGKVVEYTVHHSMLEMGQHSLRPVKVPLLTPLHCWKHNNWYVSIRTGPWWSNRRGWPGFLLGASLTWGTHGTWMNCGEKAHCQRQYDALDNALLENLWSCHPHRCYFKLFHLSKHCCRPWIPFHKSGILPCHKAKMWSMSLRSTAFRCWLYLYIAHISVQSGISGMWQTNKSWYFCTVADKDEAKLFFDVFKRFYPTTHSKYHQGLSIGDSLWGFLFCNSNWHYLSSS